KFMRVLFDFFINIARWAWIAVGSIHLPRVNPHQNLVASEGIWKTPSTKRNCRVKRQSQTRLSVQIII
ncbi:MAG: hypothetical protein ACLVFZ_01650, partial [Parasutterella sp.]|uniref:hypothetical protein n=1 Tax=Parasutterella sp. TaxID=2049037 RepID=UPI00399BEBBD